MRNLGPCLSPPCAFSLSGDYILSFLLNPLPQEAQAITVWSVLLAYCRSHPLLQTYLPAAQFTTQQA